MPDKVIIIIVLSFDHRSFDQLNMSNHSMPAWGTDPPFSHKSVVSITHEQNIICSKTLIVAGADEQELATPILSQCHGIFTD